MKFFNKHCIKFILASCFVFTGINNVYAMELEDYKVLTPKIQDISFLEKNIEIIEPFIEELEKKVNRQKDSLEIDFKTNSLKLNKIKSDFGRLKLSLKIGDSEKAKSYLKNIINDSREVQLNIIPSRKVETRGLYIDADNIPVTKPEITKLIKEIKYANFNVIYPEVFRRGFSIFNNNIAETEDRFKNTGFNVLDFMIQEAHKNNIDVYPWVWAFRVKSPLYSDYFLKKYPDLIAKRKVTKFENREPLFLSPASSQARNLVLRLLRVITVNYDIDGLLLDYIRYDETMSYDMITEKNFRDYYFQKYQKYPPSDINKDPEVLKELQFWREEQVTSLVKTANLMLKNIRPQMKIGAAIFRTEKEGRLLKMQDWRHWESNNYIDFVCPMLYTDSTKDLNDWINSETDKNTRLDYLYPSLGAHKFNTADDIYPLIGLLHKRSVAGLNVFSLAHIGLENLPDLRKSIFKNEALIPQKDVNKSFEVIIDDLINKIKKINNQNIIKKLSELKGLVKKADYNSSIKNISSIMPELQSLNKNVKAELTEDLEYILKLFKTEQRIDYSKNNYIKVTEPPLPIYPLDK